MPTKVLSGTHVLMQGETFAVFDLHGDINTAGQGEEGLYHEGTRFLSRLVLQLGETQAVLLNSAVQENNVLLSVDLTNPELCVGDSIVSQYGALHLRRLTLLWQGVCYYRFYLRNYGMTSLTTTLLIEFDADYADIFEVRGVQRSQRGHLLKSITEGGQVLLGYEGIDGVARQTRVVFTPTPAALADRHAQFEVYLPVQGETTIDVTISCELAGRSRRALSFDHVASVAGSSLRTAEEDGCTISTSNGQFDAWLHRSLTDLAMLVGPTPHGPYPYAGIPWFSTPFGRDGLITALSCLWIDPGLARGVLAYLAATQADEVNPDRDAEPGKILHEARKGEMAVLGEIPFDRYYGTIDATPLFVMLAGAYYERTDDSDFIRSIWPNIESAIDWMKSYGDRDGDGFIEYFRHSPNGLVNQGWKDSHDAVFHADGSPAQGPIAICEVQGYYYAALRSAAKLASVLGQDERASELVRQARKLREQFEQMFWCEDLSTYALALDGNKSPCLVRSSNAGHCLLTEIASKEHAQCLARTLLDDAFFSGWGIRTIAASEARYNPMSYHNGTVWPHDNALIAYGLALYCLKDAVLKVATNLFDASRFVGLQRLPEFFCGFPRHFGEGPTLYPVACSPQAWSAAAPILLLQACLGLRIDAPGSRIVFSCPALPESLQVVRLENLRVGQVTVSLLLERRGQGVGIEVLHNENSLQIVLES